MLVLVGFIQLKAQPQIYFLETSYDFGDVLEDSVYCHDFKVVNIGDGVLVINSASQTGGGGSCGVGYSKEPLNPGDTMVLRSCYRTHGRGFSDGEPRRDGKPMLVISNSKDNSSAVIRATMKVFKRKEGEDLSPQK